MADNTTPATTPMKRAGDVSKGIGDGLGIVLEKDMIITDYLVTKRPYDGDERTIVILELATVSDPANKQVFHAWSDSLATKIVELPKEDLPMIITFYKATTKRGNEVITFR